MLNYTMQIGIRPALTGDNLKAVHDEGERLIIRNTPFSTVSGWPPYSTVSRNLRENGQYVTAVYLDGAYMEMIGFYITEKIEGRNE